MEEALRLFAEAHFVGKVYLTGVTVVTLIGLAFLVSTIRSMNRSEKEHAELFREELVGYWGWGPEEFAKAAQMSGRKS